jgi:site-specific DNA-methyltransferase (adenine-specific)
MTEMGEIILGDCLEVMRGMADNTIDLVVADPPYGINMAEWDKDMPIEWFGEILRLLKDTGAAYVFGDAVILSRFQVYWEDKGVKWKTRAVWVYEEGPRSSKTWVSKHEDCLVYHAPSHVQETPQEKSIHQDPRWGDYRYIGNVWKANRILGNNNDRVDHVTQKPLKLIKQLVKAGSKEGDTVLDPFLGSGTTTRAAKDLNRNYIGIEINPEYVKIAKDRLKQEVLL